jgi:hypothetical protein
VSRLCRFCTLALLLAAGCRRATDARPVDEKLLLTLEEARAWQHRADTHLADGDVAAAVADVEQVLKIAFPPGAPEGEEARLDAWARLAKLHLGATDESRSLADLDQARKEATRDSFYRAHLETVAGEVYEARAKRLSADAEGAKAARRDALAAYQRSIEINQRVQAALLREGH